MGTAAGKNALAMSRILANSVRLDHRQVKIAGCQSLRF
jgi:hypothetical protein